MKLDLFMNRINKAIKHAKEVQRLVNLAQKQCRKVKNNNDWLDNAYSLLNSCDFDIDGVIDSLKAIIEESVEELTERNK